MFPTVFRAMVMATIVSSASCFVTPLVPRCYSNSNRNIDRNNMVISTSASCALHGRSLRTTAFSHQYLAAKRSCSSTLRMKVELGPEETVEKYGLEAGLFKVIKSGGKKEGDDGKSAGATAQDLLKRYGSAYLITSITLAAISFGICYVAVSNGVDMADLLSKVGIQAGASAETTGTVAVAYAIHKAASPIRFPPTVALTPVVAKFLGKEGAQSEEGEAE